MREGTLSAANYHLPPRLREASRYLPGVILGIFAARLLGERVGVPGLWAAVAFSVALGAAGGWLLARRPLSQTWPALLLLAYVVYPEPDPLVALPVAAVSLVAAWLQWRGARARPMAHDRVAVVWPPVLAGAAALALYVGTLAPDVLAADSGELQVVAAQLGVAHPPGFPLYVMVSHLFVRALPFVSPACAVNLFSAVTSAIAVGIVYRCVHLLTGRHLPAVIAAVALATATTYWSQATTANVRSLTGLFAALIILTLIHFRQSTASGDTAAADRWLAAAAVSMGFGLTHHVSLVFLILVGLVFVAVADRSFIRTPRRWLRPALAASLGLLPLLYLPLRASAGVRGASPDLATWSGFIEHVLATGFRGDLFYYLAPAELGRRLLVMGNVLSFQFTLPVLVGIAVGLLLVIRRDRSLALLLVGTLAVYVLVAATYRAPQTVEYMIPGYVAAAVLLGNAAGWLPASLGRWGQLGEAVSGAFAALLLVAVSGQLPGNVSAAGAGHEATAARDYAGPLLAGAPDDSVILAHWHWATPLWYLREVEGVRPDVDVRFVFPEGEPYEATWERRTREAFAEGRPVVTTWVPPEPLEGLPATEPMDEAILFPQEERTTRPPDFTPVDVAIGESIAIVGYGVELPGGSLSPGEEAAVTVAWRPGPAIAGVNSLFLHLVGPDNVIYAQDDQTAVAAVPGGEIALTRFRITPRPGTPLGSLGLHIGAAGEGRSDRKILTQVDIQPSPTASWTRNRVNRRQLGSLPSRLVGYDWDHTAAERSRLYLHWHHDEGYFTQVVDDAAIEGLLLGPYRGPWGVPVEKWRFPRGRDGGHYVPLGEGIVWTGETLNGLSLSPGDSFVVDQELHSARPINRDYVVSVRLIGLQPDGVHWAWWDLQDSIPAMGAIPTLKWVEGSFVRSPHRVTVDEAAGDGQALTGALTLYDAFTNRPLPILDERLTAENPWIPLCQAVVVRE